MEEGGEGRNGMMVGLIAVELPVMPPRLVMPTSVA